MDKKKIPVKRVGIVSLKLVKESIRFALENDQFIVNSQHFEEAWNTGITSFTTLSNRNPFNLSLAELASKIRREN